jgi:hypothetical protein
MKRHLAVVKWIETSGGEQRLCNNIFMSVMLRVGLRASGNCSNAIKAVARASAMMNWSRPVTDAKLAVFGLLIAPPRQLVRLGCRTRSPIERYGQEEANRVSRHFKGYGRATREEGFLSLHFHKRDGT